MEAEGKKKGRPMKRWLDRSAADTFKRTVR